MKVARLRTSLLLAAVSAILLPGSSWAHVTLQTTQPLRAGTNYANVVLNVPNEKNTNNTKVTLEIPDAFLRAGGRVNRVNFPPGWTITLEKQDKPADILEQEKAQRAKRSSQNQGATQGGQAAAGPGTDGQGRRRGGGDQQDREAAQDSRNKWITKVTFEASGETAGIPPDGFEQFLISFQLPKDPGQFRFPAVQTYADGQEVSWSELVGGAANPAPTLAVVAPPARFGYSDLPVPLSGLSLLVSCCALVLGIRPRAAKDTKDTTESSRARSGELAGVRT